MLCNSVRDARTDYELRSRVRSMPCWAQVRWQRDTDRMPRRALCRPWRRSVRALRRRQCIGGAQQRVHPLRSRTIRGTGERVMLAVQRGHVFRPRKRLLPGLQRRFLRRTGQRNMLDVPCWHEIQAACQRLLALRGGHVLECG